MTIFHPSQIRKAIGTAIVGVYAWAQFVVASSSDRITADEWLLLGGVGVAVAAVFGLTNAPPEEPVEEPVVEPIPEVPFN